MYESPIMEKVSDITTEIRREQDREIMNAILSVGINVDKNELVKALSYDRQQYDKGYSEGYAAGQADISHWISVEERLPDLTALCCDWVLGVVYGKIGNTEYVGAVDVVFYETDTGAWYLEHELHTPVKVTHWMPLPDEPEDLAI